MALVGSLFVVGGLLSVRSLSNQAIDSREGLEATLPDQFNFTPAPDGTIGADRLERFLAVRRQLMPFCSELTELGAGVRGMDDRVAEIEAKEEPAPRDLFELLSHTGRISRGMLGIGRRLGQYSVARNEALLEQEMGLGEYTWIYVIAYYSWLEQQPTGFALSEEGAPRIFQDRVLGNVQEMSRRQVAEMERRRDGSGSEVDVRLADRIEILRAEVEAMDREPQRLPFPQGLPPFLEVSLEPFREELEAVYCAATSELDFMRTEGSGWKHDHL